jgi:signal transduction histidine kinase
MKTTAARLSALYLLLFMVVAVVLVFYTTSLSIRAINQQTRDGIDAEVAELGTFYDRGGLPMLARVLERRTRQPSANLYLIADANGQPLAGNVSAIAPGVLDRIGWTERPFRYERLSEDSAGEKEQDHFALAVIVRLPNQMLLLVGRDLGEPEKIRVIVRRSLGFALAMMAAGGLLIWLFVGRRALKRIDQVSAASRRIVGGDLNRRLPVSGAGDEFDRLSENLNVMIARIAKLNEGLRHVSDNIAHDLKTPLTRLRNRAEAALAGRKDADEYREAIEQVIAESDDIIRNFNAILMISRIEAGSQAANFSAVDLMSVIGDVVELYEPVAEEAGVKLEVAAQTPATISGSRELIGQALSNIVDNAIKYSSGNGDNPSVAVSLVVENGAPTIRVEDTGPGIPSIDRERVTERFVRLEKSRTQPGSGLGLSLAKAVMSFHRGRLDLQSRKPEEGDSSGLSVSMMFQASGREGI